MKIAVFLPGFFLIHLLLGRAGSIPYGIAIFHKWYTASLIIIPFDFLQILFFSFVYKLASKWSRMNNLWRMMRINIKKFLKRSRIKRVMKSERKFHSSMLVRAQKWGELRVIFIAGVPFVGGGMWSGVLLTRLLKLSRIRGAILLMTGSIASCLILSLGLFGIKTVIMKLF